MIEIYNNYDQSLEGGNFSSYKKNLGNKLFIYAACRILSEILDCNLILPDESYIRRESQVTGQYVVELFPFKSILNRQSFNDNQITISDDTFLNFKDFDEFAKLYGQNKIISTGYYSRYEYYKPYKKLIREFYSQLKKPKRNKNDIVMMLRNSRDDSRFVINDEYYLNILENETFDNLYVCLDHVYQHNSILEKISKYNPIFIEDGILNVFSEITSFDKIIACQGTFSFWASFLSEADVIYWPLTKDGPNSNNLAHGTHINLIVDDEERYKFIKL